MCGYFANIEPTSEIIEVSNQMDLVLPSGEQVAYQRQSFNGLITKQNDKFELSNSLWWFALKANAQSFEVDASVTSFNARDLTKPLWSEAFQTKRAVVFATQLGESLDKQKYLMRSDTGFALACLYKDWVHPSGQVCRSFSVVTRDPHPRYKEFHSKSTPLFLPLDLDVIDQWLEPAPLNDEMQNFIKTSQLTSNFEVYPVNSYIQASPALFPFELPKD